MKIYFSLRILKYFTYKNKETNKYLPMTFMGPITNFGNHNLESQKSKFSQNNPITKNRVRRDKKLKKIPKML